MKQLQKEKNHQHLQAVGKEANRLFLILTAVSLNHLTGLFPEHKISPFPFYSIEIGVQFYVYFLFVHFSIILVWWFIWLSVKGLRSLFYCFIAIELVSLLDYLLIYEKAWFIWLGYKVQFTDFKIILYGILIVNYVWEKKYSK